MKPTEQINFIGISLTVVALLLLSFFIDINALKELVGKAGIWAPIIFILLKISTIVVAPISGSPLYPIAGVVFGFVPGLTYVVIGDFLGYTIAFSISRYLGRAAVHRLISNNEDGLLAKILARIETRKGFFYACILFFPVPELLSYAAGLSKLPYRVFISTLWPLWILFSIIVVFLGSKIDLEHIRSIAIPFLIPIIIIVSCIGIGAYIFHTRKKRAQQIDDAL